MPGGVNSPVRAFRDLGLSPLIAVRGEGDQIWDVDGHDYIDFCCSWGALILGHAPPGVVRVACEQIARGSSFGIATPYENACAAKIKQHMPSMEKMRFVSSGTEAAMSAIRLARGFTGRARIVKFDGHYHGHSDGLLISAGSGVSHLPQATSLGVLPEHIHYTNSLPFNDIEAARTFLQSHEDIAAVILEPIAGNMGVVPAERDFLMRLREETQKRNILLIFDEVITGFRVGLHGAQGLFGITPDLTILGKIIGGGFSASAFGGRKEIMDLLSPLGNVYQAGTHSGNPVAMCAGLETLLTIEQESFYSDLHEKTEDFLAPIRHVIAQHALPISLQSAGSMFTLFFGVEKVRSRSDLTQLDTFRFRQFFQALFEAGIYFSPSPYEAHFLSSSHTPDHLKCVQETVLAFLNH
jgi:glutamate-1-semialdehyde 2,1-aminomutase